MFSTNDLLQQYNANVSGWVVFSNDSSQPSKLVDRSKIIGRDALTSTGSWKIYISIDPKDMDKALPILHELCLDKNTPTMGIQIATRQLLAENHQSSKEVTLIFKHDVEQSKEGRQKIFNFLYLLATKFEAEKINPDPKPPLTIATIEQVKQYGSQDDKRDLNNRIYVARIMFNENEAMPYFYYRDDRMILTDDVTYNLYGHRHSDFSGRLLTERMFDENISINPKHAHNPLKRTDDFYDDIVLTKLVLNKDMDPKAELNLNVNKNRRIHLEGYTTIKDYEKIIANKHEQLCDGVVFETEHYATCKLLGAFGASHEEMIMVQRQEDAIKGLYFSQIDSVNKDEQQQLLMKTAKSMQSKYGQVNEVGSTLCSVMTWLDENENKVKCWTTNIGDSVAYCIIIGKDGSICSAIQLNTPHENKERGRDKIQLGVTRSIGDKMEECRGLSHEADVTFFECSINPGDQVFVVVGSDGLATKNKHFITPALTVNDIANVISIHHGKGWYELITAIMQAVYQQGRGSTDNISLGIVKASSIPTLMTAADAHGGIKEVNGIIEDAKVVANNLVENFHLKLLKKLIKITNYSSSESASDSSSTHWSSSSSSSDTSSEHSSEDLSNSLEENSSEDSDSLWEIFRSVFTVDKERPFWQEAFLVPRMNGPAGLNVAKMVGYIVVMVAGGALLLALRFLVKAAIEFPALVLKKFLDRRIINLEHIVKDPNCSLVTKLAAGAGIAALSALAMTAQMIRFACRAVTSPIRSATEAYSFGNKIHRGVGILLGGISLLFTFAVYVTIGAVIAVFALPALGVSSIVAGVLFGPKAMVAIANGLSYVGSHAIGLIAKTGVAVPATANASLTGFAMVTIPGLAIVRAFIGKMSHQFSRWWSVQSKNEVAVPNSLDRQLPPPDPVASVIRGSTHRQLANTVGIVTTNKAVPTPALKRSNSLPEVSDLNPVADVTIKKSSSFSDVGEMKSARSLKFGRGGSGTNE